MKKKSQFFLIFSALILMIQACNMPGSESLVSETTEPLAVEPISESPVAPPAETPGVQHQDIPISLAPDARPYPDVDSSGTAPEERAPYGDSYDINRLERPFLQDMTYIPDMDIASFSISEDDDWYFVSIELIGKDPNSPRNINYAVELDRNQDGFGDFLILAEPPYSEEWSASNIEVFEDTDRDTAGNSALQSDSPFSGNGFDALIHSPADGVGDDPDLAWVRIHAGQYATVQFALKKSWAGSRFMVGVMADAGLKDVSMLDYVDRFTEAEAGSPIRKNAYYPLRELYAVDNTCYQAFGFNPTGFEPKVCPVILQPTQQVERLPPGAPTSPPGVPPPPPVDACAAAGLPTDPGNCTYGWYGYPYCMCGIG
jgi:hypothetical protein